MQKISGNWTKSERDWENAHFPEYYREVQQAHLHCINPQVHRSMNCVHSSLCALFSYWVVASQSPCRAYNRGARTTVLSFKWWVLPYSLVHGTSILYNASWCLQDKLFWHVRLADAGRSNMVLSCFWFLNNLGNSLLVDKRNWYLCNHLSKCHTEMGTPRERKALETQVELQRKKQEGSYCLIDCYGLLKHSAIWNEKKKAWMILILILQSLQTKNVLFVEIQALV